MFTGKKRTENGTLTNASIVNVEKISHPPEHKAICYPEMKEYNQKSDWKFQMT